MAFTIKEEFKKTVIGFRGGGRTPLGERSVEDINYLAWLARSSKSRRLLGLFEGELPTEAELKKVVTADEKGKAPAKEATGAQTPEAASAKTPSSSASSVSNVGAVGGSAANASGSTT